MAKKGVTLQVFDDDSEASRILKNLEKIDGASAEVGFFEGFDGPGEGAGIPGSLANKATIPQYAAVNEFGRSKGANKSPSRPFMRHTFDTHRKNYERITAKLYGLMLDGKRTTKGILTSLAVKVSGDIVDTISRADSLFKKRKRKAWIIGRGPVDSALLIVTGVMRGAVTWGITMRGRRKVNQPGTRANVK